MSVEILEFMLGLDHFRLRWRNPLHGPERSEVYRFRLTPGRKQLSVATTGFPSFAPPPELRQALEKAGHWTAIRDQLIRQELDALAAQFGETVLAQIMKSRRGRRT